MEDCRKLSDEELAEVTAGYTLDADLDYAAYLTGPDGQVMLLNKKTQTIKVFDNADAYWAWRGTGSNLHDFLMQ